MSDRHCIISLNRLQGAAVQTAFKEWTVIVDALGRGEQILILRKGGIREGKAGFQVLANSFWLFPTQFHQQRESVIETAQRRFDSLPGDDDSETSVPVRYFAEIVAQAEVEDWEQVASLAGQHVWRQDVIQERFEWGQKRAIFALVVRVSQLASPINVPMLSRYGGCRSWLELEPDMPTNDVKPVLDEDVFHAQLSRFQAVIQS